MYRLRAQACFTAAANLQRRENLQSFVQFPLTGCAGAPRDEFTFKLILDLYDRTSPHRFAEPPELRGAFLLFIRASYLVNLSSVSLVCALQHVFPIWDLYL